MQSQGSTASQLLTILNDASEPLLPIGTLHLYEELFCPSCNDREDFGHLISICDDLTFAIVEAKRAALLQADTTALTPRLQQNQRCSKIMATTPTVDRFLTEIVNIVRAKNSVQLNEFLVIEPPYGQHYSDMISELRVAYPKGSEDALESKCTPQFSTLSEGDDSQWTAFTKFMVQYFCFLRDVNIQNLLDTYNLLSELVQKCNSALQHATMGILVLPTVVTYSQVLSRLAIGLDKQPELIAHLATQSSDEGGGKETLPERAANIIRQAFVTCLNDRTGSQSGVRNGRPEGKKVGIYRIANLCLKVLFQCRKTRNAEQIFVNIYNQSPPLSVYPRAERVTYLYYLGRFLFSNNHFYRAQLALQTAFDECHSKCLKQRRLILIYLISSNLVLGRFPNKILERPEAVGLGEKFLPICHAIRLGDLASFRQLTELGSANAAWFRHYRILLQIENRGEVLVWRSLARKTFLINGSQGNVDARKAPTLDLEDILHLAIALQEQDPSGAYTDPDLDGADEDDFVSLKPDILEIECIFSSLIDQGMLGGFISHRQLRFAIKGAKRLGVLAAGFPNVWSTMQEKSDGEVPGWKKDVQRPTKIGAGKYGPGMVVNLSGARPAGSR